LVVSQQGVPEFCGCKACSRHHIHLVPGRGCVSSQRFQCSPAWHPSRLISSFHGRGNTGRTPLGASRSSNSGGFKTQRILVCPLSTFNFAGPRKKRDSPLSVSRTVEEQSPPGGSGVISSAKAAVPGA